MKPEFWQDRWLRGETGFHQGDVNPYLAYYYGSKGPDVEHRSDLKVFVPLCGKSIDMNWLVQNGYQVVAAECSSIAVQDFFIEQNLPYNTIESQTHPEHIRYKSESISIYLGDYFALQKDNLDEITDIFDRASLIALPQDMRKKYVQKITELQNSGTRTLLITLTYPQHEMQGPPFSVSEEEVHDLYIKDYRIEKLCAKDILPLETRFQEKGLTSLIETAYKLTRY